MRSATHTLTLAAALALAAGSAFAQDRPPPIEPEATRVDDVVVIGGSLRERTESFVEAVTAPPQGRGPARWPPRGGVCVGVANLRREPAQAIADRVSEVARDMGLAVGEPGCEANVLIIATDDANALAAGLTERWANSFRPDYAGAARSRRDLDSFVQTDRPIRWWHVSLPVVTGLGTPAVRTPGNPDPPRIPGMGRTQTAVRNVLLRAYVIIDVDQIEGLTLAQLADYVAMVTFAQVDPEAVLGDFPTILNVFADPGAASGMTDWDRAYLGALYRVELSQRTSAAQLDYLAGDMARDRRLTGDAPESPSQTGAEPAND